jgi:hypothetical protein
MVSPPNCHKYFHPRDLSQSACKVLSGPSKTACDCALAWPILGLNCQMAHVNAIQVILLQTAYNKMWARREKCLALCLIPSTSMHTKDGSLAECRTASSSLCQVKSMPPLDYAFIWSTLSLICPKTNATQRASQWECGTPALKRGSLLNYYETLAWPLPKWQNLCMCFIPLLM